MMQEVASFYTLLHRAQTLLRYMVP